MRRIVEYTLVVGVCCATAAPAQNVPEPPAVDPSRVMSASQAGHREFSDPGNEKAKAFAAERGISVGEATSQLRRQAALNMFIDRLRKRYPDGFSFVSVEGNQITVGMTDPTVDLQSLLPPGLATVKAAKTVYSDRGTVSKLDEITAQLIAAGLREVDVGVNPADGRIEFLTKKSRQALEQAIARKAVKVDSNYEIVADEIVTTGALYGGKAWNVSESYCSVYCGGTTGFSLIAIGGSTRYVSSAAHLDNGASRYNTSNSSTYSSGGVGISSIVDLTSKKLDIQYGIPSSPATNPPNPYFWDGTTYVQVTNYTYPTANVTFCKYGRNTGKTCGVHDVATRYADTSNGGVYMFKIKNNGTGIKFNDQGDSGGPVYYGNYALGWVHGHNSSYDMYYTSVSDFKQYQTAADLIVLP